MKTRTSQQQTACITWQERERRLTLTGEPVLEMKLSWPGMEGSGMGGVSRYYQRLCTCWERHWGRDGYWSACAELAQKRAQSRPFSPWQVSLSGRVTWQDAQYFSVAMQAREVRGDGRALEYRWGDTWRQENGGPVGLSELVPAGRGWRGRLLGRAEQAAQEAQRQGLFLRESWRSELRRWFSPARAALEEGGLILCYPQCTIAPAAEGAVELHVPLERGMTGTAQA